MLGYREARSEGRLVCPAKALSMHSTNPPGPILKIVVAFLDGRRLKGSSLNFSALKESFDLFPGENPAQQRGIKVELKDVKAIFFVKDFSGNPKREESSAENMRGPGRGLEVTFGDGEKVVGATQGYNPQKIGFFLTPIDSASNNSRIFVVTKNAHQIKPI